MFLEIEFFQYMVMFIYNRKSFLEFLATFLNKILFNLDIILNKFNQNNNRNHHI